MVDLILYLHRNILINKAIFLMLILFSLIFPTLSTSSPLPKSEIIRLGEKMYRDGILPSGEPMKAYIRGDVEVDGRFFSCSSCHLRAGLGSFEGGVITPATTGKKLYQSYKRVLKPVLEANQAERRHYASTVSERPAYNRQTLAKALRFGLDPSGHTFNDVMPRYMIDDADMDILIDYLEQLSYKYSPGATLGSFSFATIVTDDVPQKQRDAMLLPLKRFIAETNKNYSNYKDFLKFGYIPTPDMKYAFYRAELKIWELKGAPETWKRQLIDYQKKSPAFAILAGISNQDWTPIHQFCEEERIPALFPITDFPDTSDTGWYTYYFNKGYYQEGEGAARHISTLQEIPNNDSIIQIVQDSPQGKRLGEGFEKTWRERSSSAVKTVLLSKEEIAGGHITKELENLKKSSTILLWVDSSIIPKLESIIEKMPIDSKIYISSEYFGKDTTRIPESVREKVYITFLYRLTPFVGNKEGGFDSKRPLLTTAKDIGKDRITWKTVTMLKQITLRSLSLLYDNIYRDHLLDLMSMQMDVVVPDYERLSFGPGQRYASKGCYIIQLGKGENPEIIPRSEWVIS